MADSKPRLSISLKRKIKLIEEVEANPHKLEKAIADEQQIPQAKLSNILKNREKYKKIILLRRQPAEETRQSVSAWRG